MTKMSITYIPAELRRLVAERAGWMCEYCLIEEVDTGVGLQVDHVVGEKHGGPTQEGNLAYACPFCNRAKGSDVGSIDWESGAFVRFFNPRMDKWSDHFVLNGVRIEPRTVVGSVTVRIFGFNVRERLLERQALQIMDRYPSQEAARRMNADRK
jgi:hypothetical protein